MRAADHRAEGNKMPPISTAVRKGWFGSRVAVACGVAGALCLVLIAALVVHLEKRRRAVLADLANESVQRLVRSARQHLASRARDQAVSELTEAQTMHYATEVADVAPLLVKARKGQAEALFDNALNAIQAQELV